MSEGDFDIRLTCCIIGRGSYVRPINSSLDLIFSQDLLTITRETRLMSNWSVYFLNLLLNCCSFQWLLPPPPPPPASQRKPSGQHCDSGPEVILFIEGETYFRIKTRCVDIKGPRLEVREWDVFRKGRLCCTTNYSHSKTLSKTPRKTVWTYILVAGRSDQQRQTKTNWDSKQGATWGFFPNVPPLPSFLVPELHQGIYLPPGPLNGYIT